MASCGVVCGVCGVGVRTLKKKTKQATTSCGGLRASSPRNRCQISGQRSLQQRSKA